MRKIEKDIIHVLRELKDEHYMGWSNFSLSIRDSIYKDNETTIYRLWNHKIFEFKRKENIYYFSFCGYMTNTTKSRLNAILSFLSDNSVIYDFGGFYQKNYALFWSTRNGIAKKIDASKCYRFVLSDDSVDIEIVQ